MAVEVDAEVFQASEPDVFSQAKLFAGGFGAYDVHPSGERFALLEQAAQCAAISLFTNWNEVLETR